MKLGEKLREVRLSRGLTQEQLAERIGVAKSTLTGYEKGNREPDVTKIKALATALAITADELLGVRSDWDIKGSIPPVQPYDTGDGPLFSFSLYQGELNFIQKIYRHLTDKGQAAVVGYAEAKLEAERAEAPKEDDLPFDDIVEMAAYEGEYKKWKITREQAEAIKRATEEAERGIREDYEERLRNRNKQ